MSQPGPTCQGLVAWGICIDSLPLNLITAVSIGYTKILWSSRDCQVREAIQLQLEMPLMSHFVTVTVRQAPLVNGASLNCRSFVTFASSFPMMRFGVIPTRGKRRPNPCNPWRLESPQLGAQMNYPFSNNPHQSNHGARIHPCPTEESV
jgi:hypothetical protein